VWWCKRLSDVVVASLLVLALGPVMLAAAAAVKLSSPGPVLFRQERVGLGGASFRLLKFRSMHVDCDDAVHRQ
jgi:putative colanic acid biosynthesis UDP-glucose lipid carrier transferase